MRPIPQASPNGSREWNALADELDRLFEQCRSAPHTLATSNAACDAWNAGYLKIDMTWALVDPYLNRPDEAGDRVRTMRWYAERLRAALERDPGSHKPHNVRGSLPPRNLRLPDTLEGVREEQARDSR